MSTVWRDLAFSMRLLNRNRGFGAVAILTLGLGIGANTAIFSIVNGVLLRPLPYRNPENLVFVWDRLAWVGVPRAWAAPPEVLDLRAEATLFEGFSALRVGSGELTGGGRPVQVSFALASANLFDLLGVEAAVGRTFLAGDDLPSAEPVMLLSHSLWKSRFGADPSVVGRRIRFRGVPRTVVGVLPEKFNFLIHASLGSPQGAEIWAPYQVNLSELPRGNHSVAVLGRIKDGVSFREAQAELNAIGERHDREYYRGNGFNFDAVPVHADLVRESRPALLMLLGAVGFVLLIAASNIATLLLAQVQKRRRELAVRRALGAGRVRICRQLALEALALCGLGGLLGLSLSSVGARLLLSLAPEGLPLKEAVAIDGNVYLFSLAVTVLAALLCGLAGAVQGSRTNLTESLKEGARGTVAGGRAGGMRNALVVAEVALTLLLLLGGVLMIRSFRALQEVDPGFDDSNVLTFNIRLGRPRYDTASDCAAMYSRLLERLRALPSVVAAGGANALPLSGGANQSTVAVLGEDEEARKGILVDEVVATPGYFAALGIALLQGREFSDGDRVDGRPVAIVDQKLADLLFPDGDILGGRISLDGDDAKTIVGVVRQPRLYRISADDRPQVYLPHQQLPTRFLSLALRSNRVGAADLAASVRGVLARLDPDQPVFAVQTMHEIVGRSLQDRRFRTLLLAGFATVALLLSSLGVYGVVSYLVAMRRPEIAIRVALGAPKGRVLRLVMGSGGFLVGLGVAIGLPLAILLSRAMQGFLYGVSATDPFTFAVGPMFLFFLGLAACYIPARRAAGVDPLEVLRAG